VGERADLSVRLRSGLTAITFSVLSQ